MKFAVAVEFRGKLHMVEREAGLAELRDMYLDQILNKCIGPMLETALTKAGIPYRKRSLFADGGILPVEASQPFDHRLVDLNLSAQQQARAQQRKNRNQDQANKGQAVDKGDEGK